MQKQAEDLDVYEQLKEQNRLSRSIVHWMKIVTERIVEELSLPNKN